MRWIILFVALAAVATARAQETLTLDRAAGIALSNSPVIKAAEARERAARQAYREIIGNRLPSVDIMEMVERTTNPAEVFAFQMNQERFSMADFGNPARDPNNPEPFNTTITRVEASLPVFTGGMLAGRTKQARLMLKAAGADRERARNEVTYKTAEAWLNVKRAGENLDLMRRSLETMQTHLQQARDYFAEGLIASPDVLRAEVYLAELQEWLVRSEQGESLAQAALNFAMGQPQTTIYQTAELPDLDSITAALTDWIRQADQRRHDLLSARFKLKTAETESQVALSAFLPAVGVLGRYDLYDDKLFGRHGESWAVMGVAKWNIFHGGADFFKWQKTREEARSHQSDVSRFAEGVALEVRQTFGDLEAARLRFAAAAAALQSGRENLRVIDERYRQGVAKMTDLLDAQTALRELEVRELNARYDRYLSLFRLRLAAGSPVLDYREEVQ
jgi:outer membrane protein TolC